MKILFTPDLHGNCSYYGKAFQVAEDLQVKVVVNSGDVLTKEAISTERGQINLYG